MDAVFLCPALLHFPLRSHPLIPTSTYLLIPLHSKLPMLGFSRWGEGPGRRGSMCRGLGGCARLHHHTGLAMGNIAFASVMGTTVLITDCHGTCSLSLWLSLESKTKSSHWLGGSEHLHHPDDLSLVLEIQGRKREQIPESCLLMLPCLPHLQPLSP